MGGSQTAERGKIIGMKHLEATATAQNVRRCEWNHAQHPMCGSAAVSSAMGWIFGHRSSTTEDSRLLRLENLALGTQERACAPRYRGDARCGDGRSTGWGCRSS